LRLTASIIVGDLFSFLIDALTADLIALPTIITFHGDATHTHEPPATPSLVVGTDASSSSPASGPGNRMTTAVFLPCYASKNIIDNKFLLYVIIASAQ
jgi:hypothetical protein